MLTKQWQRLVKEALIAIYRDSRTKHATNFPVYYFSYSGDVKSLGLAVQSLQQIPQIPWPDEQCIILSEEVVTSMVTPNIKGLAYMVRNSNYRMLAANPDESEFVLGGAIYLVGNRIFKDRPRLYYLTHKVMPNSTSREQARDKAAKTIAEARAVWGDISDDAIRESDINKYAQYLLRVGVWEQGNPVWIAYAPPEKQAQPGLAADILACLSNLAIPCHYMVHSRFEKGFGPTGALKRLTAEKRIFTTIPYDRLYRVFGGEGESDELHPHYRRGHIRHYWKESGLNRLALPDNPLDRIRLVHKHKVRRMYIHPMWIGDPEFVSEGCSFEVLTKDLPLKPL